MSNGTFDMRKMMGTLHRRTTRFNFTSLEGIRDAYRAAFKKHQIIEQALDDKSFNALSAVRNLIVHRAGIADEEYREKQKNAPLAPSLDKGESLSIDGELVENLIAPVVEQSLVLIRAVDAQIANALSKSCS